MHIKRHILTMHDNNMAIPDDYFKQPGSVPFKWEIRPGVPKVQYQYQQQHQSSDHHQKQHSCNQSSRSSSPSAPQNLRPPPAGFNNFQPPLALQTRSVLTVPRTRSNRNRLILAQSEVVSSGCFTTSPAVMTVGKEMRKKKKKKLGSDKMTTESEPETDYRSDLETLSRWSVSTRRSLSPFQDSPSSSSFSSYRSSPRPVSDAEWAGFGLF